jgi:Predicted nucleotide-binding protein containing TIR-like domain
MSPRTRTFGAYLRQFARSISTVELRTFDHVQRLISEYLSQELGVAHVELSTQRVIDGSPGLTTEWATEQRQMARKIRMPDGRYTSHVSLSFDRAIPLWLVNPSRKPLHEADKCVDLWSAVQDLPYDAGTHTDTRTSIILPLMRWTRVIGVLCFEAPSYLEITEAAKDELVLIADAESIAWDLFSTSRLKSSDTQEALADLEHVLHESSFPRIARPQIFVSFSERADRQAISVIKEVLREFQEDLIAVFWDAINKTGSISQQVVDEIARSQFGLCYLSEPNDQGNVYPFRDNANVIFEAGMLHSLTHMPTAATSGWIPLREKASPPTPFDFAGERISLVPRSKNGDLLLGYLREDLRDRIQALLMEAE